MAKRIKWKMAVAVLAVVIAGIVYCVFFAEEKDGTVQYRTGEEAQDGSSGDGIRLDSKDGAGLTDTGLSDGMGKNTNASTSDTWSDGVQTGSNATQYLVTEQTGGTVQNSEIGQNDGPYLIYVHICGAVKSPGVYSLPENSRVCDVIAKAGGLTENAADDYVNQARFLSDGERVYIPEKDELSNLSASQYAAGQPLSNNGGSLSGSSAQSGSQENLPVNINTAGINELTSLPGIGESRAESIIAYREKHGTFNRIEDIMKISGIKGAAYEKIKDRICTGNE